jgi:protein required for attachment to host cells
MQSKSDTQEASMKDTTWIIAADASRARILESHPGEPAFREVRDWLNPDGRAKGRDLNADAQGRASDFGRGSPGHGASNSMGPPTDPAEHEVEKFSRELGGYLDKARTGHLYDHLYLVAPPKFLGLLRRNLSKECERLVVDSIDEDLTRLAPHELQSHLREHLGHGRRA